MDRKKSPSARITQVPSSSFQLPSSTQGNPETVDESPAAPLETTTSSPLDNLAESASAELQLSVNSKQLVPQQKEVNRSKANDIRAKVELLEKSRPIIVKEIDRLRAQKEKLLKELDTVNTALTAEESKLENLPTTIEEMKADMKTPVREAVHLHKVIKPIPGTADEDQQKINKIDQIRLDAIDAIQKLLRSA
ncbi:hypothetical protein C2845_PM15G01580 [Panicum miliaceum]|uniref:Aminotransferase-like protein n=1 Tax=Panicum miliaceum TaxID=4540 RepID=A0A3L6Q6S6_PANMI|nr:hypothetical protein C2845_PM15G01580 [Panicum miliaceum]